MNWSFAAIFLALLFTTACSQRGGRRYVPDQPLEESLAVDNHRFQSRSRGDVENARRGEGRRARIQEPTETNSWSTKSRSRSNNEEPRQFHSRVGTTQKIKQLENRQFASRRSLETGSARESSREGTRNERFRSRESSETTDGALKVKNTRGRTRVESTIVEHRSGGGESKRFPSRGTQEREVIRTSKDLDNFNVGERPESRHRSPSTRKYGFEAPKNPESVTEGRSSRQPLREEIRRSGVTETTEKFTQNYHNIPITEGRVLDLTSASNEIEIEKKTRPVDSTATEKLHSRQLGRDRNRPSSIDATTENNHYSQRNLRKKTEEIQTRGNILESRRRSRPTDIPETEKFHSRQLSRNDYSSKRSRLNSSTEKIRNDNDHTHATRGRKKQEFTSRGSSSELEKRRLSDVLSTERFHSKESSREKPQSWTEHSTSTSVEPEVSPEFPDEVIQTPNAENKVAMGSVQGEQIPEAQIDTVKPITSQPEALSTENTVDFPTKSNDVEEPNRISRKLETDLPDRTDQNRHRSLNQDFENSKRGRLESTLSRDRSRSQESPPRSIDGRRSSRRFGLQSVDTSRETNIESKERRTTQRLSSRTKSADIPSERGKHKLDGKLIGEGRNIPSRHRSELVATKPKLIEKHSEHKVTESRVSTKTLIQNEQKNEVTLAGPVETPVVSSQRALSRNFTPKPNNRGRGKIKVADVKEEKDHSGEVKDEDNYPEVYKQLKKSGTDPKDILALLKARKAVREKLEKTNSKIPQPDTSLNPIQRPVIGSDEIKTPLLHGTIDKTRNSASSTERNERFSNFRSSRFKTPKTIHEITTEEKLLQDEATKEKKYNPYNYQEIRSFSRKKNSNLSQRNKNYRNGVNSSKGSDEQKQKEKNANNELVLTENHDPVEENSKKTFTSPGNSQYRSTFKNKNIQNLRKEGIINKNNDFDEFINEEMSESKNPTKNDEEREELIPNDEFDDPREEKLLENKRKYSRQEGLKSNSQSATVKEASYRDRNEPDSIKVNKKISSRTDDKPESESIKPVRRTSFNNPDINKFKSGKESKIETSFPDTITKKTSYIPRNRESDYRKFKARTEKTVEDVSVEPSIIRNYNLYNRNEHSFRRRSFTSPASEGTEVLTTVQYKNSMLAARTRPTFVPQRKKFVAKTTTLDPLPISRYKARKASLSKLFNEEVLKEEDDLRPNIENLSIDSLVSESEHLSFTTEASTISSIQKRPKYTESHIQKVPPKRRGSEYFRMATSPSTTSKSEVYTVLAIPYYDENTSVSEAILSTEFVLDPTTQSTTITTWNDILSTTTPVSTTEFTPFSSTDTPSTTTVTTTETSQSSTLSSFLAEGTTIKTTTTEPTTIKTTTDFILAKIMTEPIMTSTTESITTIPTTTTQLPTTITTTTTTTTTPKPTTTKRPTTIKTTTKRPSTTKTTTKRPSTTKTTTKLQNNTTTKKITTSATTKRPTPKKTTKQPTTVITTKKPKSTTITIKQLNTLAPKSTAKPTTRKTTVPSSAEKSTKHSTTAKVLKTTEEPTSNSVIVNSTPSSSTSNAAILTTTFKIDELLSTKHPNFLSTIAYLAKNLTVTPALYENANTAKFRTPSMPTENTTPMEHQSVIKNDYFVYGLLPNNNVVRKVVKTTAAPVDVPFYIYGLYPNGTIVRRFPNGTVVPDETEEENEVIGKIEPGSEESLENVVKKDNPLSYLYPPGYEKPTTQMPHVTSTTTDKPSSTSLNIIPLNPRIAPVSNLEKPATSVKDITSNSSPTTIKSTTKLTTTKPPTKSTTTKSTISKLTTSKPQIKSNTAKSTTKLTTAKPQTKSTTTKSTTKLNTSKPQTKSTTTKSTAKLTTANPQTKSTTTKSTAKLTTANPQTKSTTTKSTTKPQMKQAIKPTSAFTQKSTAKPTTTTLVTKSASIAAAKSSTKIATTRPVTTKPTSAKPIAKTTTSKPPSKTTPKSSTRPTTTKHTPQAAVTKSTVKTTAKPSTKSTKVTTIKPSSMATTKSTMKTTPKTKATTKIPIKNSNILITSTTKSPKTKPNDKSTEKSTIKTITPPLSDAELLNNLLSQDVKEVIPKGTTESTVALADKVIQLAIERAQKSSTASPVLSPEDLQSLSTKSTPIQKQSLGEKLNEKSNKLTHQSNNNKTGKISVWVIPPEESTTSKPIIGVSKSEAELLNAFLTSPSTIENLSLSDQLLLADILSSTAAPQTTRKKKKKSKTTTTTTTPAPPAFPILQYLFGRNRGGGGGLFQRGLFRGGGLRNLESATTSPQNDGGIFQNDGFLQGQGELAAESQEDPQQGEGGTGLVSAAINVSRAVSQFMGYVIQGAAQSFQNYLQTRTRALANALTYPPAS